MRRRRNNGHEWTLLSPRDLVPGTSGRGERTRRGDAVEQAVLARRRPLILPKYLAQEAEKGQFQGPGQDRAHAILVRWADLAAGGHLDRKETALDAEFLAQVFGAALGYRDGTQSPDEYELERNFTVPDVGTADGALGVFTNKGAGQATAVIELKSADVHVDSDHFNGRTPVQQCWDYLNNLPECRWGIVSNFISFRLYRKEKGQQAFEHFALEELRDRTRFRQFWVLLERGGLLRSVLGQPPRADRLLEQSSAQQRKVGDELYEKYDASRLALIDHLHKQHRKTVDDAIAIAQKLLDRIIFVAFCEDRGLIKDKAIERAFRELPAFTKVTNPRWQNFLALFQHVDRGHDSLMLDPGFDGGLFRHDPEVDDLQLDDEWTHFFHEISTYDFSNEVNVDVLGHLFEKSVTDLERIRRGGLTEVIESLPGAGPAMPKSAQRKRQGIYYTPPEFTAFIVRETVGAVVDQRLESVAKTHGLDGAGDLSSQSAEQAIAYHHDCLAALRTIRICDPACGSGAFLIQAYELLFQYYSATVDALIFLERHRTPKLADEIPDMILNDNLFGVDLSKEAVEITQLALWIRSARRGCTLADLSRNIVQGNSLVADRAVDPSALDWERAFPRAFPASAPGKGQGEGRRGFDCVIGNPPWERLKLQEREFFSAAAPQIASAVSAAERRALIGDLKRTNPDLFRRYEDAKDAAEKTSAHVRASGRFPLTARGDINSYMLFAELARSLVAPEGRVGLLVPSGIATDDTTKDFFNALMDAQAIIKLHDFENKEGHFPDVHRAFKFSILVFGGAKVKTRSADFVFFAHTMDDLADRNRHIPLSGADMALLNPNTRTCPIFRGRRDADLTKAIYGRVPILVDESRGARGNPWGVRFVRMFDQTNDAELFHTAEQLGKRGFKLAGNQWRRKKDVFLPLYEAKMIQAYDHRAASVVVDEENWMRQGQTAETSLVSHQQEEFVAQPRWWVSAEEFRKRLGGAEGPGYLAYKDVTSPTNERTMIAAMIPVAGVVNSAPLVMIRDGVGVRRLCCLLADMNSFVLDFVARQKVGNIHLNFFIVEQLPLLPSDAYGEKCPWDRRQTLEKWISDRALKLTCTADDMIPLAKAAGFDPPVHKWKPDERARLLAELDAAYFILYGIKRADAEYILSTFCGTRRRDEADVGGFRTAENILKAFDEMRS